MKKFFKITAGISLVLMQLIFQAAAFAQDLESQTARTVNAVMMQDNGSLWVQNQNGIMIWATNIRQGENLEVYLSDKIDDYGTPLEETKTAWRVTNGESAKNEFTHVRYNNTDYWAISSRIATTEKTGRISSACAVYRSIDLSDVRLNSLPQGTFVCVGEQFNVTEKISFTEVTFFDYSLYSKVTAYVLSEKVTSSGQ